MIRLNRTVLIVLGCKEFLFLWLGYYGGQPQGTAPPNMPPNQYGFSGYGYGASNNSGQENQ